MTKTKYKNIFVEDTDVYKLKKGKYKKLCQWIDSVGYYQVVFKIDERKKHIRVHRLIAETLIPNPNNYPMVNHIDGNKLNNKIDNLEWCTNSYNTKHAYDNGLYYSRKNCPIKAISKDKNEEFIFSSIRSCSETLHINRKTLTSILKKEKKTNNYKYDFEYLKPVSTIPDECMEVGLEISTSVVLGNEATEIPKRKAI